MSIHQLNLEGKDKVQVAIDRLQNFEPPEGYFVAFSGGKDSIVLLDIVRRSGVKHDVNYSVTGIDPPELVQFMRKHYLDVILHKPKMSIWRSIAEHKMMPLRMVRFCCADLKEIHGAGRIVVLGVRWAESPKRKARKMVELCKDKKSKSFVNPIIDFSTNEVWEYIEDYKLDYCSLYDIWESGKQGKRKRVFSRLGCIMCPMTTARLTKIEMEKWPKLAEAWKRACYRLFETHPEASKRFESAEDSWQWWISRKGQPKVSEAQCMMFE